MEHDYLKSIQPFLDQCNPMEPVETGVNPSYSADPGIRACIFDIYGTLLISASGDIEEASLQSENLKTALTAAGYFLKKEDIAVLSEILKIYEEQIRAFQKKAAHTTFPEVDIREVWEVVARTAEENGWVSSGDASSISALAFVFELLSNPVYPMPGMKEILERLRGMPLGIISNAQFYTPVTMNRFLSGMTEKADQIDGFLPDLSIYSYKERRGKPDPVLFEVMKEKLEKGYGIKTGEAIFIGNDMRKDVKPARDAGFKTVLFAGDKRSLKMYKDKPEIASVEPDHVITDLRQILEIAGRD